MGWIIYSASGSRGEHKPNHISELSMLILVRLRIQEVCQVIITISKTTNKAPLGEFLKHSYLLELCYFMFRYLVDRARLKTSFYSLLVTKWFRRLCFYSSLVFALGVVSCRVIFVTSSSAPQKGVITQTEICEFQVIRGELFQIVKHFL